MGAANTELRQNQQNAPMCNARLRQNLKRYHGLLQIKLKVPIYDSFSLSLVYSPGVGASCLEIQKDYNNIYKYTNLGNALALVTDGTDYHAFETNKWHIDAAIPQLEANCLFYKIHTNIDAYPFVININKCQNIEDFIEAFTSLSSSYVGVELFNVKEERSLQIQDILSKRNDVSLLIFGSHQRNYIRQLLKKNGLDKELPCGFISSIILRGCMDCVVKGFVPNSLIEHVFEKIMENKEALNNKTKLTVILQKVCVEFLHANNIFTPIYTKESVIARFKNYFFEGNKAWIQRWPNDFHLIGHSHEQNSLALHARFQGMIKTQSKIKMKSLDDVFELIQQASYEAIEDEILLQPSLVRELTFKSNWAAIISNGTAVLGFGDIGAGAGLPVMEGKSCIFKQLGGVDLVPICIQEKDPKKLINIIERIAPVFSAINLEDIKAPECFEIENTLKQRLDIPVFHDDQHGTAIVTLAAVLNCLRLTGKKAENIKLIVNGGGAAGLSITTLLLGIGIKNIIICDTKGSIYKNRPINMNKQKDELAELTNPQNVIGSLEECVKKSDVFIGVSAAKAFKPEWVKTMNEKSMILAMANPEPEIMPADAKKEGAYIVGTGRSDFKNQVNNSLAFPGIFRAALDVRAKEINLEMKMAAAQAISQLIPDYELSPDNIIPSSLDTRVPIAVAKAVAESAMKTGVARIKCDLQEIEENIRNFILERNLRGINSKI
ncbi:malate dehydrogenase, putative [Ichthyophthirius multifiliis]|uniref:Malic enzyme n=1 Tax=Ichthyophthirius multifiliis TaxID=5932 RepID=G0R507_ICHMU|nr:malate dehydrogenase, putative [Ichthyophthirius multifiliis]EGR27409.1 malate dehydrogenase, putative [Ichthyophthirius multifiliis]|eukprot:XP_004024319.1 malate dehydrogenase, putative [Ichthyophthirius multifiliis]